MFFNLYPYLNVNDLNLDYTLKALKEMGRTLNDFIAFNTIKFADPMQWDLLTSYTKNTIVIDNNGNAYLSIKDVPSGVSLDNTDYWNEVFNFSDYVEKANKNLTVNYLKNVEISPANYVVGDWLVLDEVLYKVIAAISEGQMFVVDTNIQHFTIEDFLKDFITTVNNTIIQYKNDIDASELAYRNQLAQDISNTTASLQAQLDAAIAGVTVDSEVINARIGADGHTYSTLGDAIRNQLNNLNEWVEDTSLIVTRLNWFNPDMPITSGYYYNGSAVPLAGYCYTEPIPIDDNVASIHVSATHFVNFMDASKTYISTVTPPNWGLVTQTDPITVPSGAKYVILSTTEVNLPSVVLSYVPVQYPDTQLYNEQIYGRYQLHGLENYTDSVKEGVSYSVGNAIQLENRYNPDDVCTGYYLDGGGNLAGNASYTSSGFIYVGDLKYLYYSGVQFVRAYGKNFEYLATQPAWVNAIYSNQRTQLTDETYYIRFATETWLLPYVQIGGYCDRLMPAPYGKTTFGERVYVSKSTACDYSTLLEALLNTTCDVVVLDGDYDVVNEYNTLYSGTFFDNAFDRTVAPEKFRFGLYVAHRKIYFAPHTSVIFDLTATPASYSPGNDRRFSLFFMGPNSEIEGLTAKCKYNWYAIHDDTTVGINSYVKYKNCIIESLNTVNINVIGAGMQCYHEINNCILDNGYTGNPADAVATTVRYHNSPGATNTPTVIIKNSWVNGHIYFGYYGSQTTQAKAIVNNCSMGAAIDLDYADPLAAQNITLYAYANEIR